MTYNVFCGTLSLTQSIVCVYEQYAVAESELILYKGTHENEVKKLTETQNNLAKTSSSLKDCQRFITYFSLGQFVGVYVGLMLSS